MNIGKNMFSSFEPKKPSVDLKQRVLKAATGAAEEPVTYMPLLRTFDWGLLAASLALAGALALMNGFHDSVKTSQETAKGITTEEALMMKSAGFPASGTPRGSFRKKIVVLNPDKIGG